MYKKITRDCAGSDIEALVDMSVMTYPDPCSVQLVKDCDSTGAPEVSPTLNCDLSTTNVDTKPGLPTRTVIVGQEKPFVFCTGKEFDKTILCTPTGDKVVVVTTYDSITGVPTSTAYNFDGTTYAGSITDLTYCDAELESDAVLGCDNGVPATQWIVKKDGIATGVVYYTDNAGTVYTPTAFTLGACTTSNIQIVEQNLLPLDPIGVPNGLPIKEIREYTNGVLTSTTYVDTLTGAPVTIPAGTAMLVEEQGLQKEIQLMCDNGVTFLRHYIYSPSGAPLANNLMGFFDTDQNGAAYTPSGAETVGACIITTQSKLFSGAVSIANGVYAAGLGPDGTTWDSTDLGYSLRSVTITARKSNDTDAVPGSGANQVMIRTSDLKFVLLEGESYTFSVEDLNTLDFIYVDTLNDAAASVTYVRA